MKRNISMMDEPERKMHRDLNYLHDVSEASSSFSNPITAKGSKNVANTQMDNNIRMGKMEKEKLVTANDTDEINKPPLMANYCLPGRVYCLCKECKINKAKASAGCGPKCNWKCKSCHHCESKFIDYVDPRSISMIRFYSIPPGIVDPTTRMGNDLYYAIMDLIIDMIGGDHATIFKKVLIIDADDSGKGESEKDITVGLSDVETAKQMAEFVKLCNGITYYAGVEIKIEVKFYKAINDEESNESVDVNNDEASGQDTNEGELVFDDFDESMKEDSSSELDYPSDPSDSEDDISGDSDESNKAFEEDSFWENEESDDEVFNKDGSQEIEEEDSEITSSVDMEAMAKAYPLSKYNKLEHNMKENIDPKWINESKNIYLDNGDLKDPISVDDGMANQEKYPPKSKKPHYSV